MYYLLMAPPYTLVTNIKPGDTSISKYYCQDKLIFSIISNLKVIVYITSSLQAVTRLDPLASGAPMQPTLPTTMGPANRKVRTLFPPAARA